MKALSIETRLLFISVVTAVALALIAAMTWYRSQHTAQIHENAQHFQEIELLLLKMDQIRGENGLSFSPEQMSRFEKAYGTLEEHIGHFAEEAETIGADPAFLDELSKNIKDYRSLLLVMVDNLNGIGRTDAEGFRGELQASHDTIEDLLETLPDQAAQNALGRTMMHGDQIVQSMLHRGDIDHGAEFDGFYRGALAEAGVLIPDDATRTLFAAALEQYRRDFQTLLHAAQIVGLSGDEGLRWQLGAVILIAFDEIEKIKTLIEATSSERKQQIGTIIIVSSIVLSIAILVLIHLLGRSITHPLKQMTTVMGAMAKGDYKAPLPGKGRNDEIGKMAAALEVFGENAKALESAKLALQEANEKLEEHVEERTRSLSESESALFNMIHESPIAIGLTDENGTPVFWNDSFLKFGWRKDTPGASNDFQLMFANPGLRREFFERLKRGEQVRNEEVEIVTASEEPAWVEMSIQSLVFEGQKSFLTWVHDITERKMREEIQAEARRSAEEANQAKSDFLATMSHEIRTPLNGIMTMSEMLETTELTSEQKGMAVIVRDSSATLVSIINDVLDFSKIESGNLELDEANMSLVQVVESVADLLDAQVAEKGIHLFTYVDPEAHDFFLGDPVRIRQVLTNLAGNAVKFTEKGEVVIEVTIEESFPDRATVAFRVIDSGIGIPLEKQGKLFQPFVQADTSTARRFGGTGLGLSISRALVEAMGGEIGLESTEGLGSTFWFKAPLKVKKEQRASRKGQLSGKGAIIVSENVTFSNVLENYLNFAGVRAKTATGYDRARALVKSAKADNGSVHMMLVDGDMPEQQAAALVKQVRADKDMAHINIVAMGYRSNMMVERPAYLDQVFAELPMPVRRNQLWEVAAAAAGLESLDGAYLYSGRESDVGPRKFAPPDIPTARDAGALILVAEDNPVNQKVIRMLLDRLGYAAEMVDDGVQALEALRNTPYGLLLSDCHMPNMDGYDLSREIRRGEAEEGLPRLPIVALTADALIGVEEKCRECGMDAYLKKPIARDELNRTILKLLPQASSLRRQAGVGAGASRASLMKETSEQSPEKRPEPRKVEEEVAENEGKPAFDRSYLDEVTGGDPEMTKMLIDSYIETTPPLIDDLVAAFGAGDAEAVRETAHAIKGASNMSGALRLGEITKKIQQAATDQDLASVLGYKDVLRQEFDDFLKAWEGNAEG